MLYDTKQNLSGPLPTFRNINYYNITGSAMKQCGTFECLEQSPCTKIDLNHIDITCNNGGFSCQYVDGQSNDVTPKSCINKTKSLF